MKKTLFRTLWLLLAAAIIGFFVLRYVFQDSADDLSQVKPAFVLTAAELVQAYSDDEALANQTYMGETIEISGVLLHHVQDEWSQVHLVFMDPLFGLTATMDSAMVVRQQKQLEMLEPGKLIRVKGRCDGLLTDVRLSKSVIIE